MILFAPKEKKHDGQKPPGLPTPFWVYPIIPYSFPVRQ